MALIAEWWITGVFALAKGNTVSLGDHEFTGFEASPFVFAVAKGLMG